MARVRRNIAIHCASCRTLLYRYSKGGTGALVKCFLDRILVDHTAGDCRCPSCGAEFARPWATSGKSAYKIIASRVYVRGMTRK